MPKDKIRWNNGPCFGKWDSFWLRCGSEGWHLHIEFLLKGISHHPILRTIVTQSCLLPLIASQASCLYSLTSRDGVHQQNCADYIIILQGANNGKIGRSRFISSEWCAMPKVTLEYWMVRYNLYIQHGGGNAYNSISDSGILCQVTSFQR